MPFSRAICLNLPLGLGLKFFSSGFILALSASSACFPAEPKPELQDSVGTTGPSSDSTGTSSDPNNDTGSATSSGSGTGEEEKPFGEPLTDDAQRNL